MREMVLRSVRIHYGTLAFSGMFCLWCRRSDAVHCWCCRHMAKNKPHLRFWS